MTKSERNPNNEIRTQKSRLGAGFDCRPNGPFRASTFGLHSSFVIRHSSFSRAFTLAEVLAALAFMAIVIPVAIQGLRVAGQAGEVAMRKSQAARIADKIINQSIVTTNWSTSQQSGQVIEGTTQFQWTLRNESWKENPMRLISADVSFMAQDKKIVVSLSTLVDSTPPGTQPTTTTMQR